MRGQAAPPHLTHPGSSWLFPDQETKYLWNIGKVCCLNKQDAVCQIQLLSNRLWFEGVLITYHTQLDH